MDGQIHWVNNFWGQDDAGYRQLMKRVHTAKETCDELKQFYRERLSIEQEYAKKLTALSRRALGSHETGGMKHSLETVRSTTKAAAATHETVARQLSEQLIAPLDAFSTAMRGRTKTVEDTMGQLTKAKNSQNSSSEKARNKYMAECNKISGYQAQQNLLMGRELDRNNQKLDRATYQVEGLQRQYQDSLRALAQTMENWNSEWRIACDKIEQAEGERLTFIKSNLWAYANALSAACVADDEACETVRVSLERCDPARDLEDYSREFGTGSKIQDPPEFVNFLQGFSRENDHEDGHYHVANFGSTLDENEIPDLGVSSPPEAGGSVSSSPISASYKITPMSSPGTPNASSDEVHRLQELKASNALSMQHELMSQKSQPQLQPPQEKFKEVVKKRRSWAMPFKRKSEPETSNLKYVSALDQPITAPPLQAPSPLRQPPSQPNSMMQQQQQSDWEPPTQQQQTRGQVHDNRRQSWAPASTQGSGGAVGIGISSSLGKGSANTSSVQEQDPLLQALEKLKTPNLKPRPKSMGYAPMANAGREGPPSPYGNGSPTQTACPPSPTVTRRKPVHRKQVGSEDRPKLPVLTSDGRPVIKHSRALYDYRAAIPEEVTFRKGDLLLITEMQEDGWWDCEVLGRRIFGLAPSNFLTDAI